MDKGPSGRNHVDPRLLSLIDKSEQEPWLFMKDLNKGDVLEVQTMDTLYTMKVTDPEKGRVLVNSNGRHITQETEATVSGSTITGTGTMMKIGGITVGLRLILFIKGVDELILSLTQEVRVNGFKILPVEHDESVN